MLTREKMERLRQDLDADDYSGSTLVRTENLRAALDTLACAAKDIEDYQARIAALEAELTRCRTTEHGAANALDRMRQHFGCDLIDGEHPADTARRIREAFQEDLDHRDNTEADRDALARRVAELKGAVRTARSYFCDPYSTCKDPAAAGFKEMADRLLSEENK